MQSEYNEDIDELYQIDNVDKLFIESKHKSSVDIIYKNKITTPENNNF